MKISEKSDIISVEMMSIIQNTNDLMFVKNRDFVYITASKSFALDCVKCNSVEEVIGKTDFELFEDEAIARKYREDDESLFASGKSMVEYQEEFPDKDGSRHLCLTTKYLIHDMDGNPVAIFGQYHDICEQVESEIARRRDINKLVVSALSSSFFASNYVDLTNHTYITIQSMEYARKMVENCITIEAAFDTFINTLVKPEFQDKMRQFCKADTIAQRVKGKKQIACEYLSNVASGWCRASFFPTEWDENGEVTHVLFAVSSIDENIAHDIEEAISNKKNLKAVFDNVPGGIVMYDWDGKKLKIEKISKYYEDKYGYSMLNDQDSPDYIRIHPDDVDDYQKAIYHALTVTHSLEYVFRVWNREKQKYGWTQINAVSQPQENGHSYVYAMYTDVTVQKEAEIELEEERRVTLQEYNRQWQTLMYQNDDAMCMCNVNLTKNEFSNVQAEAIIMECAQKASTLDEFLMFSSMAIMNDKERKEYQEIFNHKALLALYEKGENHIKYEHFYRISEDHTEWVETVLDAIKNPITGDIVGIGYARSLNNAYMSRILLEASLDKDYATAALLYADTGEYYRYEKKQGDYCKHRSDYWGQVHIRMADLAKGRTLTQIRNSLTKEKVLAVLEKKREYSYAFYGKFNGNRVRLEARYQYVDRENGLILATLRDITDAALYQQYKYESEHDRLTDLLNRQTVFEHSRELLNDYPEEQFIMLHCDVRHFHLYNAFFGDETGDKLLCRIADVLRDLVEQYDYYTYGRIESDVFCAFVPYKPELLKEHIKHCFDDLEMFSPNFPLQLDIGVYWVTDPSMSVEAMFSRATIAAKSGQINLFGLISKYDEGMEQNLCDTQQITGEMSTAIAEEQFKVYLQPKYSLRSEELVGAEALVRWIHPQRGMITPGKFIPVFEKNGFIAELDKYMWEHVCKILKRWENEGREMLPISVNMSRVSLYSHATVPFLKKLVQKYNLDPKYLELELTESAYIDDPEDLKRMLKELQQFGFKILMDDFGSGYSSLNTLKELPVDILKLDMKFLSDTQNDNRAMAVLSSVVRMSKLLNLPIVAEGVEKREQADYLRSIGCEYVQGFLFAKPMSVEEYEKILKECRAAKQTDSGEASKNTLKKPDELRKLDSLVALGVLEYSNQKFAYLRTNQRFLTEFGMIDNTQPASGIFRNHLDEENYRILIQALEGCSGSKKEVMFRIFWIDEDGTRKEYYGHIHYNGTVGAYADLSMVFINVTNIARYGFEE